jgi:hypothetical protein
MDVARSNTLLQHERLLLERAMQAQRREREVRLVTGDAVAATIAHEVKQPLATMITSPIQASGGLIARSPISTRQRRHSRLAMMPPFK